MRGLVYAIECFPLAWLMLFVPGEIVTVEKPVSFPEDDPRPPGTETVLTFVAATADAVRRFDGRVEPLIALVPIALRAKAEDEIRAFDRVLRAERAPYLQLICDDQPGEPFKEDSRSYLESRLARCTRDDPAALREALDWDPEHDLQRWINATVGHVEAAARTAASRHGPMIHAVAATQASAALPYAPGATFAKGDVVSHPRFGVGRVVDATADRVEVEFPETAAGPAARRRLVHGSK